MAASVRLAVSQIVAKYDLKSISKVKYFTCILTLYSLSFNQSVLAFSMCEKLFPTHTYAFQLTL